MNVQYAGTAPLGTDSVRSVALFSWQDDPLNPESDASSGSPGPTRSNEPVKASRADGEGAALSDARLAELRRWIAEGGHNSPDIAEQVARRILERGDV
jgi:hypothetical protein